MAEVALAQRQVTAGPIERGTARRLYHGTFAPAVHATAQWLCERPTGPRSER